LEQLPIQYFTVSFKEKPLPPFQAEPFQALNEGLSNIKIALEPLVMGNTV
jgi:hypothetical protein